MTLMPIVAFPGLILPDTNTIRLLKIEKLMEYGFENSLNSCQQHCVEGSFLKKKNFVWVVK